jgi:hypothetical protein
LTVQDLMPKQSTNGGAARTASKSPAFTTADDAIAHLVRKHGQFTGVWTYHDRDGVPIGLILRWNTANGKDIRPVSLKKTSWVVGGMPTPRPLYGLPELVTRPSERVYVCEGEPAAEAARSIGLLATTSAHGANSVRGTDWTSLAGRDVTIFADNDDAGLQYARTVASILLKLSPRTIVRIVLLPGLPPKGDFVEFLEARDSRENSEIVAEVESLVEAAQPLNAAEADSTAGSPKCRAVLVRMQDVIPKPVEWLWPGRIAVGKITVVPGDPGLGKSFITLDLAARVTTGRGFPDRPGETFEPGGVVLLSAEDDLNDTVRPLFDAAGADISRITALQAVKRIDRSTGATIENSFCLATDLESLEEAIIETPKCRLVIVDPVSAYLGSVESHTNAAVRGVLAPLAVLAAKHKVAIVVVTHLRKGEGPAMYRSMGSLAFVAAARGVWAVAPDPCDPTGRRRLFLPVKNNLGNDLTGLAYTLSTTHSPNDQPVVEWDSAPVTISADEALGAGHGGNGDGRSDDAGSALEEAMDWLREILAEGPVPTTEVQETAREAGLSWATVKRARPKIGAKAKRDGFGRGGSWLWHIPGGIGAQPEGVDTASKP